MCDYCDFQREFHWKILVFSRKWIWFVREIAHLSSAKNSRFSISQKRSAKELRTTANFSEMNRFVETFRMTIIYFQRK